MDKNIKDSKSSKDKDKNINDSKSSKDKITSKDYSNLKWLTGC